jgi:RNA polymerase sigma-70 factor (ECF subfamily)
MNLLNSLCVQRELRQRIANTHGRLYRVAYAWGHDPDLAKDIVQETIAKALKNVSQLREPEKLDSWLFGILANCWRDHFRRQHDFVDLDDVTLTHDETPEQLQHREDIIVQVRSAVARLSEGQRHVVTLVDLEGFSYAEVASILGIPVGTVMSRLARARGQLADMLLARKVMNTPTGTVKLRSIK